MKKIYSSQLIVLKRKIACWIRWKKKQPRKKLNIQTTDENRKYFEMGEKKLSAKSTKSEGRVVLKVNKKLSAGKTNSDFNERRSSKTHTTSNKRRISNREIRPSMFKQFNASQTSSSATVEDNGAGGKYEKKIKSKRRKNGKSK